MNKTIVTIDPSINCTAVVIDDEKHIITPESYIGNKSGLKKWFKLCENYINYITIPDLKDDKSYSVNEINKLKRFENIADIISNKIFKCKNDISIFIEGYSYSSQAGPLIDLVTLSTCIRLKCTSITDDITVVSPKTLKSETARFVYQPVKIKNKIEYRNNDGVAGGKFTKRDMCLAIMDSKINCAWSNFLRDNKEEILKNKNIPKPIEDINDAKLLFEINNVKT